MKAASIEKKAEREKNKVFEKMKQEKQKQLREKNARIEIEEKLLLEKAARLEMQYRIDAEKTARERVEKRIEAEKKSRIEAERKASSLNIKEGRLTAQLHEEKTQELLLSNKQLLS